MKQASRRICWAVAILALAGIAACGSSSDAGPDAEPPPPDACAGEVGCNGTCELGNSWGVGRYCTPGGGECADTPDRRAPFCTADFNETDLWFCTRPCEDDSQCGEDARCATEDGSGPSGCFPIMCD